MRFIILSLVFSLNSFSHDFTNAFARVLKDQRIPLPPENIDATQAARDLHVNVEALPKSIKKGRLHPLKCKDSVKYNRVV